MTDGAQPSRRLLAYLKTNPAFLQALEDIAIPGECKFTLKVRYPRKRTEKKKP